MVDTVSLVKEKAEKVQVDLRKKGISTFPPLRVRCRLDVSGSTSGLYTNHVIERAVEKLFGVAYTFDDDGSIDMGVFDGSAHDLPPATIQDYGSYVQRNITSRFRRDFGGSTNYEAALRAEIAGAFGADASSGKKGGFFGGLFGGAKKQAPAQSGEPPVLLFFITDGDPDSGKDGHNVMEEAAGLPIYFSLIGVGRTNSNFATLRAMADRYDNVGFVNLESIDIPDEALFDALNTDEFISFLRRCGAA